MRILDGSWNTLTAQRNHSWWGLLSGQVDASQALPFSLFCLKLLDPIFTIDLWFIFFFVPFSKDDTGKVMRFILNMETKCSAYVFQRANVSAAHSVFVLSTETRS